MKKQQPNAQPLVMAVYLDNGVVYEYDVASHEKAREHAAAIIATGYVHVIEGELTHFPPHRISKVKATGDVQSNYYDRVRGT